MNNKQTQLKNSVLLKQLRPDNRTATHRTVTIEIFTLQYNLFQLEFFFFWGGGGPPGGFFKLRGLPFRKLT